MGRKIFIVFVFVLCGFSKSFSQTDVSFFNQSYQIIQEDSGKVFLKIDNSNFFKNNEYFGQITDGYTALGFHVTPQIEYSVNTKLKIAGGVHLLKYSGKDEFTKAIPLLSIQYKPLKNLNLIIGNIYGTTNHAIIEPMFEFERYLNNYIENGIQFLWDSKNIHADLWLDWEQYILQGDPFQEEFNVGLSSQINLYQASEKLSFSIDFQNIVRHEGGQVNKKNKPLYTVFNNATGISIDYHVNWKYIEKIRFAPYLVNYQDLSPTKNLMYIDGTAVYSTLELFSKNTGLFLGYWYSEQYITPLGNPLFESISRNKWWVDNPVREILMAKISYQKNLFDGISLSFRVETYSDLINGKMDYSYGLILLFNEKFLLR
ncbi:MAG: hypothetical protein A2W99_07935 [Bacteroidetes bacterium GWF2_33_16]|nr:MAG: hypothetical protein A2X00_10990 [Bacteroidetes bacterium GWE2_32_14]OFY03706.1 MAG: hypothetical protein A2W99_07935 [Bacteroidetes bacterium GWF2_33_16]